MPTETELKIIPAIESEIEVSATQLLVEEMKSEPRSLYNLLPPAIQQSISKINPKLIGKTEKELEFELNPDPFVCRLRLAFWREYEESQSKLRKMNLNALSIAMGVPSASIMAHLRMPKHIIWIITPPASYDIFLDEALSYGLRRMRNDILAMDIHGPDGLVDVKKADLLLKCVAFLDMRKNGGIVQRTENLNLYQKDFKKLSSSMELKEIEEKIKQLEMKGVIEEARSAPKIIQSAEDDE